MEENKVDQEIPKQSNKYKWLFFALMAILVFVIYYMVSQNNRSSALFNQQAKSLNEKIKKLESSNNSLSSELNGKNRLLTEYMPYLSLIRNLKLTDSAYASLPYKYGQQVYLMPDTTPVVINSISVTANQYEYSVKYIVRNKTGEYKSISVSDLVKSTP